MGRASKGELVRKRENMRECCKNRKREGGAAGREQKRESMRFGKTVGRVSSDFERDAVPD